MLKVLLQHLQAGGLVESPDRLPTQYGGSVPKSELRFDAVAGGWYVRSLNCSSSADLGMGTCRCVSHSTWGFEYVDRKVALSFLRDVIAHVTEMEERAKRETAFLESLIGVLA